MYIRHGSQHLLPCLSTKQKILCKNLGEHSYKIELVQKLKLINHNKCRLFIEWCQNQFETDTIFYEKIASWIISTAKFSVSGLRQRSKKCLVLFTYWSIFSPYFFKNETVAKVFVNAGATHPSDLRSRFYSKKDDTLIKLDWPRFLGSRYIFQLSDKTLCSFFYLITEPTHGVIANTTVV